MSDKEKTHKLPNQETWINLTRLELKRIFVYYIVLFFIALVTMILFIRRFTLTEVDEVQIFETTLFSFVSGLLGATFYYIRKLYKSCIQSLISTENSSIKSTEALGAKIYFYFRPIMGAVLSTLVILGFYGGFFVLLDQPAINSDKFYLFVALLAFGVGFSNGKIIVKMDNSTEKIAEMLSGNNGRN